MLGGRNQPKRRCQVRGNVRVYADQMEREKSTKNSSNAKEQKSAAAY